MAAHIDEFGTPAAYNHYAVGWAHAMDTPYQWTKQVASHLRWHAQRRDRALAATASRRAARSAASSTTSSTSRATVLDAAGLPEPDVRQRHPADAAARREHALRLRRRRMPPEARETQYFEMFCNRGIYHQGWTAVTRHSIPWVFSGELPALDDDVWELYDTQHRLDAGARPRRGAPGEARASSSGSG